MTRTEAIEMLGAARTAHMQWMARAKALIAGVSLNKELVPIMHTDCIFGQWYYGAGKLLENLKSYQDIEPVHTELHAIYKQIFELIFGAEENSLLRKLFASNISQKEENLLKAKELLPELVSVSKDLLVLLEALESDLQQMPDETLA